MIRVIYAVVIAAAYYWFMLVVLFLMPFQVSIEISEVTVQYGQTAPVITLTEASGGELMANTEIKLIPSKAVVGKGESFNVDVQINPLAEIAGAQFSLAWDPVALTVNGVAEGNLFKQNNDETFFIEGFLDNETGKLDSVMTAIMGSGKYINTSGVLATINFTAKVAGTTSNFLVSDVIIGNSAGQPLPFVSPVADQVKIADTRDVDKDGFINIADILSVAGKFGDKGSPGWIRQDVNGDGKINILDIIYVSRWVGKR